MARFEEEYPGLYVRALRAARPIVADQETARDIAAEAMARAYSRWPRIEDYAGSWVIRVAVNLAIDSVRRKGAPFTNAVSVEEPGPDRVFLLAQLQRLPRRQREVLVMRFILDLDEDRTAQVLGITTATVHTHTTRGLAQIRTRTQPDPLASEAP